MILVLLGTQNNSFKRLLEEIDKCIKKDIIKEKVVVQAGHTKFTSDRMEIFDFIPKDRVEKLIEEANIIITHGGVGSIINCIKHRKKIIAVPRLKKYGEHVNDHQVQIVENLDKEGYIIGLFEIDKLSVEIDRIKKFLPKQFVSSSKEIINLISNYIETT